MKHLLTAIMVLLIAAPAFAGSSRYNSARGHNSRMHHKAHKELYEYYSRAPRQVVSEREVEKVRALPDDQKLRNCMRNDTSDEKRAYCLDAIKRFNAGR